ncbi:MAG TPA: methyltransferase domain-containing protein [Bryobacteraceae bacterium]|nr:methyltransferase domain-containing protein [Bryobacteraceae bacterium]
MNRKSWSLVLPAAIAAISLYVAFRPAVPGVSADQRQEVERLGQVMQWKPGAAVADVGAGDGSYSFAAAERVGASGRVYSTEIDPEKLKSLRAEVAKRKLENVIVVEGTADDTKLPPACCDAIFLRHVYHHLTQPVAFDKSLVRSLKPGARLAIIDFPPEANSDAVPGVPKNRGGHGVPQRIMVDELTTAGLQVEKTINDWSGRDYCVIFVKPN